MSRKKRKSRKRKEDFPFPPVVKKKISKKEEDNPFPPITHKRKQERM